ncbi:hypothetical protein COCNU_contig69000910G000010 [Cocos nucifera]|nr:hypothetical protein [Cocos nucifera]
MSSGDFFQHIRRLRARLIYQRNLLANMEGMQFLKRRLLDDSERIINHLNTVEAMSIANSSNRLHGLSTEFYQRYENLMQSMEFTLGLAAQITLVREGRMSEVRITQADVIAHASCRACGERFSEGVVVGVLRCSHRFHRRCIVGRYAIQTRCPACGIQI